MKKEAKKGRARKSVPKAKAAGKSPGAVEKAPKSSPSHESLEQLLHQKEEIEALLSSLEDAYSEASILEEDYNDIKAKNEKKLDEITRKIDVLASRQAEPASLAAPVRVAPEVPAFPPSRSRVVVPVAEEEDTPLPEEKPKKDKKSKQEKPEAGTGISDDDIERLKLDLVEKIKEMVEGIGAKVTEKDLTEIRTGLAKFEAEMDKMKALIETIRETRRIDDEKIQRVVEGLAEVRMMVYGREASVKEQEIRVEKVMDVVGKLEPEKIIMEIGRRDKELSNQSLRTSKLEETSKEFGDMLRRIESLLRNIGSLEHVLKISNEASEKLMAMQNMERSNQKMLDKIQGIYAELSKRMEEFMLYRAKQDRVDDMMNDVLKNLDELNTKSAYFITRDDLESFRASIQSSIAAAPASSSGALEETASQKEEIGMLLKTLEEEFKSRTISKEEYEKMKKANLTKLKAIDNAAGQPKRTPVMPEPQRPPLPKPVKSARNEPAVTKDQKGRNDMLLKDLEETFKRGMISREAYNRTRKMISGKG
jgi:hypothetical protein